MDNKNRCNQCNNSIEPEQLMELSEHGLDMCMECAEEIIICQY
ncbi:hypothetical protein SYNTR_1554 [Candidatus Syntrophocurvum alkaliphilum]|uniref:Uncharacterized protein n=1 Tax=Candidatus Syntrophocurvum alkaliphilum TaxID=2293317 RepID=A0A6I6DGP1_9FIRM|nr:hypothetical protein [Candidatus Syntrophocurvum alkaliphilum]QGU00148.1 hypothetical protein SYNTR_1554 [Candidatus Syntrophocurvum alkaliphilum]